MITRRHAGVFVGFAGAALYPLPLLAAEAGEAKTGLPQLDMSYVPGQLFWLLVTFSILYVLMAKFALPGVRRVQDNRLAIITSELQAAALANEEAKMTLAHYEKALSEARTLAQTTVNDIKIAAAHEAADQQAVQEKKMTQRLHEAEAVIAAARDAAIKDVAAGSSELAKLIVERVTAKGQVAA